MKIGEAFPSKYLKAADLQGRRIKVTIDHVKMETIGDDEDKAVVYFQGKDKGLVLNKTNANAIIDISGSEETDEWHGIAVALYTAKVQFQSRMVDAIRVDAAEPPKKIGVNPKDRVTPATAEVVEEDFDHDSVPF